mgnify:CR=1 FL=1
MALIPTLTLTDSTSFSDEISFSVTDSLAVKAPSSSLTTVIATATGSDTIIVPASTAIAYLFVRHTGTTDGSTGTAQLVDVEETGDAAFARLGPEEWLFMPFCHHAGSVGVQLHVQHASVVQMEYAYWTKT